MPPPLITIAEARRRVLAATRPLGHELIAVTQALGRVLARDLTAAGDTPPFPCSAMDGYALAPGPAGRRLKVVGESRAGAPAERAPGDGEALRISTGAAVPHGAVAVIRQEDVDADGELIHTRADTAPGENVRRPGEDMTAGTLVLRAGTTLQAAELGAAVAAGAGAVEVTLRPRVQVLCTGDELREPGASLEPGEIHNSNGPMLTALAAGCGAVTRPAQRLADDRAATERSLHGALAGADAVVLSGGVSVGPHDHVKPALAALGVEEVFWGVALQPGKPTWFGTRNGTLVFGLPGNPVSAFVTFALFARPALARLQGAVAAGRLEGTAVLSADVPRNPHRDQAIRVRLERRDHELVALPNGPQASHIVTSLIGADALALIPAGDGVLGAGTEIALEPLPGRC
ncbi:MAG: molybdopterin molybdotransferase MoeA [Solirubrobacterales bacterium]|nr:molybdopterin molybdotransferase MoeA [Solirubrobacterales bacterium]